MTRDEISEAVRDYVASGGAIRSCPPCTFTEEPPKKAAPPWSNRTRREKILAKRKLKGVDPSVAARRA